MVAAASELSRMRGTAEGLRCALEWALGISGVSVVSVMANFKGKAPLQVRSDASGEELVEEGVECSGRLVLVGELGAAEPEHLIAGQP